MVLCQFIIKKINNAYGYFHGKNNIGQQIDNQIKLKLSYNGII